MRVVDIFFALPEGIKSSGLLKADPPSFVVVVEGSLQLFSFFSPNHGSIPVPRPFTFALLAGLVRSDELWKVPFFSITVWSNLHQTPLFFSLCPFVAPFEAVFRFTAKGPDSPMSRFVWFFPRIFFFFAYFDPCHSQIILTRTVTFFPPTGFFFKGFNHPECHYTPVFSSVSHQDKISLSSGGVRLPPGSLPPLGPPFFVDRFSPPEQ